MDTVTRLIISLFIFALSSGAFAQARTWGAGKEEQTTYKCEYGGTAPSGASCHAMDWAEKMRGFSDPNSTQTAVSNVNTNCGPTFTPEIIKCTTTFMRQFRYPGAPPATADSFSATYYPTTQKMCPSNSAEVATTGPCTCHTGFEAKMEGGKTKCVPYSCAPKGSHSPITQPDQELLEGGSACYQGCVVTPAAVKSGVDGKLWALWPFVSQAKHCGGADPVTKDTKFKPAELGREAPVKCGVDKCPGKVNGLDVCVPCRDTKIPGPSTSASGADSTGPGGVKVPDGGTAKQDTTCDQTSCSTTTTVKDKDGNVVGSKTEERPKENFCQENPGLQICKEGRWGGACGGGYTCDGDAIQCALSVQVHKSACEWATVDPEMKARGEAALAGGDRPPEHPFAAGSVGQSSMAFSSVIDQTNRLGGGCPSDQAISYAGRSYVIPWSRHCDKLQLVGNLMVGVTMLAAAMIVFRG